MSIEEEIVPWWQWCRLCAKEDHENNINVAFDASISTAIGKYFWVNIKTTDPTQHVCQNCYSLVNQLIVFTERVNKVQAMFCMLQNAKTAEPIDPHDLRSQYDLIDEDFDHIIKVKDFKHEISYSEDQDGHDGTSRAYNMDSDVSKQMIAEESPKQKDCSDVEEADNVEVGNEEDRTDFDSDQFDTEPSLSCENGIVNGEQENLFPDDRKRAQEEDNSINLNTKIRKTSQDDVKQDSLQTSMEPRYICNLCGKKYKNPTSFRKHMTDTHHTEENVPHFVCSKCDKVFPTVRQLLSHSRSHLPLEKKLTVPCPHCDKKFTVESVMKQHVSSVHKNEKPYMCEECGQSLKTLASFNEHKITHSEEYPYECEICNKKFKHKTRLKTHMDTHNETEYVCNLCGVRLNTKRTLKMHMLVHSEKRAYKCNFCDAEFKRGKALKNHLILHLGLRPYKCRFCEKTFTNGSNCRSHKKRFHPAELAAEEAAGVKTERISVPNISELRSRSDIKRPTAINRNSGGLAPKMRALLIAAEQRCKVAPTVTGSTNEIKQLKQGETDDESSEMHLVLEETDDDKDSIVRFEECEETVVYELVDDGKI